MRIGACAYIAKTSGVSVVEFFGLRFGDASSNIGVQLEGLVQLCVFAVVRETAADAIALIVVYALKGINVRSQGNQRIWGLRTLQKQPLTPPSM